MGSKTRRAIRLLILLFAVPACIPTGTVSQGFVEGHLSVGPLSPVELVDAPPPFIPPEIYEQYPLVILSGDGRTEINRFTAGADGNYHIALPVGSYILDAAGRAPKRIRAIPQPFTIEPNRTVRVDMSIDTGIR